jgi:hypothetical protein
MPWWRWVHAHLHVLGLPDELAQQGEEAFLVQLYVEARAR